MISSSLVSGTGRKTNRKSDGALAFGRIETSRDVVLESVFEARPEAFALHACSVNRPGDGHNGGGEGNIVWMGRAKIGQILGDV